MSLRHSPKRDRISQMSQVRVFMLKKKFDERSYKNKILDISLATLHIERNNKHTNTLSSYSHNVMYYINIIYFLKQ